DSAAAIGLLLERLARTSETAAEAAWAIPRLSMLKRNVAIEPSRLYSVLHGFRLAVEAEQLEYDTSDGVKVRFPTGWAHVRTSNTESLIRVIVEADDDAGARALLDWARDRLEP